MQRFYEQVNMTLIQAGIAKGPLSVTEQCLKFQISAKISLSNPDQKNFMVLVRYITLASLIAFAV